jgi:hypothetical protein
MFEQIKDGLCLTCNEPVVSTEFTKHECHQLERATGGRSRVVHPAAET